MRKLLPCITFFVFFSCQKDDISVKENALIENSILNQFDPSQFKHLLGKNYALKLENNLISKTLNTEINIYSLEYNSREDNPNGSDYQELKLVAVADVKNSDHYDFYVMKVYYNDLNEKFEFEKSTKFNGYVHLLDENEEMVYANKFVNGEKKLEELYKKKFEYLIPPDKKMEANKRMEEDCKTVTTTHYKDWYHFYDGEWHYTHTQYLRTTTQEICNYRYIPDVIGGGGGSGTFKNTSSGSVPNYQNCYDTVHGCGYIVEDQQVSSGIKPLAEHDNKCSGVQDVWNRSASTGKEHVAVITQDGAVLIVAKGTALQAQVGGLYQNIDYNPNETYYQYSSSLGAPSRNYQGMILSRGIYYIPITAIIHTHPECLNDGSDGVSGGAISQRDVDLANVYSNANHYAIGCGKVAKIRDDSRSPDTMYSGDLSSTCNNIK